MSFWKKLMGRLSPGDDSQTETQAERDLAHEGVDGVAADEFVEQQLGGADPTKLVDDEFKP
jgi:hypothetical protein